MYQSAGTLSPDPGAQPQSSRSRELDTVTVLPGGSIGGPPNSWMTKPYRPKTIVPITSSRMFSGVGVTVAVTGTVAGAMSDCAANPVASACPAPSSNAATKGTTPRSSPGSGSVSTNTAAVFSPSSAWIFAAGPRSSTAVGSNRSVCESSGWMAFEPEPVPVPSAGSMSSIASSLVSTAFTPVTSSSTASSFVASSSIALSPGASPSFSSPSLASSSFLSLSLASSSFLSLSLASSSFLSLSLAPPAGLLSPCLLPAASFGPLDDVCPAADSFLLPALSDDSDVLPPSPSEDAPSVAAATPAPATTAAETPAVMTPVPTHTKNRSTIRTPVR